ncbi:TPA: hypothetical protein OTO26_002664 [Staphylococcus aureus]|nr:hypothetical protein [Staphylococcus aureus]HCU0024418.1 hypothetical protein [Staphylococcus aureus]
MNSKAIEKAKAIQSLLDEYNISNDSLDLFIKEAETMPDSATLDKFNELVEAYNNAGGYAIKSDTAKDLLAFYDSHTEELSAKQSEMARLRSVSEDADTLERLYNEFRPLLD